jgi:glycerate 2-kinase
MTVKSLYTFTLTVACRLYQICPAGSNLTATFELINSAGTSCTIASMNAERFFTLSLRRSGSGQKLARIMTSALAAVEPEHAVRRAIRREGDTLLIGDCRYDLRTIRHILVVGAGKAAAPMAAGVVAVLGDRVTAGLVIVKQGYRGDLDTGPVEIALGGHPLPDAQGVAAAGRIMELLATTGPDDLVLVLISGGGSALMTLPDAAVTLDDTIALTQTLLGCGATINEINTIRKHLSRIGGGRLAQQAAPARVAALILSDVVGSPLDVIASGPTVPDATSFADAWSVIQRYAIAARLPAAVITHLQHGLAGALPETPKPGDPIFAGVQQVVVGSNETAALAALAAAQELGYHSLLLTTFLEGEARAVGAVLAGVARELALRQRPLVLPALIVAGGETTVTLQGSGLGGRNQELALGAVRGLAGLPQTTLIALATDGGDGPTDAAGAVVTGATLERAALLGLNPDDFLARNDAYRFFAALDDLLMPGPTLTNVNDLVLLAVGEA